MGRMKELEEERLHLHRTNATQQTQIEKYKQLSQDAKGKADSLDSQLTSTKKVTHSSYLMSRNIHMYYLISLG